jgi:8-oxo-dGTP pyrophosphatase MutT (NUDIX family)
MSKLEQLFMELRIRSTAIVFHNNSLLTFFAIDPKDGREFYFLPGGKIEENETAPESAERETLEEVGYIVKADVDSVIDKEYSFYWNGENINCLTLFFRAYLVNPLQQPKAVNDALYNKKVVWIPRADIEKKINYNDSILQAVIELIKL